MRRPDFLIVGAPRSGTTALECALAEHPDLYFAPRSEPGYFHWAPGRTPAYRGPGDEAELRSRVSDPTHYANLFAAAPPGVMAGERTPSYLGDPHAHARMRAEVPDARLIVVVRNPVDRAFSQWSQLRAEGREPNPDFLAACRTEAARIEAGWAPVWQYLGLGRYGRQLEHLSTCFAPEQTCIVRYRDLIAAPAATLDRICRFLGVPSGLLTEIPPVNVSAGALAGDRAPLPAPVRRILLRELAPDIRRFEHLLGRSFADWFSEPPVDRPRRRFGLGALARVG
jgi:hypothetical protein